MHLFYTPDIDKPDIYSLSEEESLHCMRVLRLRKGDEIFLTNGRGMLYKALIAEEKMKQCPVKIVETIPDFGKRNYYLHIAVAPTKNIDRIEWFIEKATEIGVDEITPIVCEHSERKSVNMERLNRIITSAMKQSLKAYRPVLNPIKKFEEFVFSSGRGTKFIAYCNNETTAKLKEFYKQESDALILIGPEGDFSESEILKAKENGYISITLGKNRYRTETAALVACHTVYLLNDLMIC